MDAPDAFDNRGARAKLKTRQERARTTGEHVLPDRQPLASRNRGKRLGPGWARGARRAGEQGATLGVLFVMSFTSQISHFWQIWGPA